MSHAHDDADTNPSSNPTFESVVTKRVSRREMLGGAAGAAALAAVGATRRRSERAGADGYGEQRLRRRIRRSAHRALKLNFDPVAKSLEDAVILPRGYSYDVLYALGDPIAAHVSDYANDGTDNPATYAYARRRSSRRHVFLRHGRQRALQPVRVGARTAVHESRGHHAGLPASDRARPSSTACAP